MDRQIVKLKLDVNSFDERDFALIFQTPQLRDVTFTTMRELGDNEKNRRKLYELNKVCSADIPGRGEFFIYEEFCKRRYGAHYDPAGAILAQHRADWIGLSVTSNWSQKGFVFAEMTGVLREYRRKGVALAMKIHGIRFAKSVGAEFVYATHGSDNHKAIGMNRSLGFVDTEWESLA